MREEIGRLFFTFWYYNYIIASSPFLHPKPPKYVFMLFFQVYSFLNQKLLLDIYLYVCVHRTDTHTHCRSRGRKIERLLFLERKSQGCWGSKPAEAFYWHLVNRKLAELTEASLVSHSSSGFPFLQRWHWDLLWPGFCTFAALGSGCGTWKCVVVHAWNPSTQRLRWEDHEIEARSSYLV